MGLDISGKKIKPLKTYSEGAMDVFVLEGFERSLLDEEVVKIDFDEENYEYVGDGPSMSYGSYNGFRNALAVASLGIEDQQVWDRVSNLKEDEDYPEAIYHIINFADNEGFIGPKAVKELDSYFAMHYDRIKGNLSNNEYYQNKLDQLVECIKDTAKVNGYLEFS